MAGVLNKSLGWLIDDLNRDNLRLAISNGDIYLQNVKIRASVLKDAGLPLELAQGVVGTLRITIPWTNLYNAPVLVQVDDVYLRVECISAEQAAQSSSRGSPKKREFEDDNEDRDAVLEGLDASRKKSLASFQKGLRPAPAESWTGRIITGITSAVIQNMVVTITNVHVQIDHYDPSSQKTFQIGVALPKLKIVPATSSQNMDKGCASKVASIHGLRMYHREPDLANTAPLDIFEQETYEEDGVNLFLEPLNMEMRIPQLYVTGPPPSSKPALQVSVDIERVLFNLNSKQTKHVILVAGFCANENAVLSSGCRRPRERPNNSPRQWWAYVIYRIQENIRNKRRRTSWLRLASLFTKSQTYANLYRRKFPQGAGSIDQLQPTLQLSSGDLHRLQGLEESLTNEEIMAFRTLCELRLVNEYNLEQKESFSHRWLGVGGSSVDSIREGASALARAEAAKFYNYIPSPDDNIIQIDAFVALHECKVQLEGLLIVQIDYMAIKAIKQGHSTKGNVQILDMRVDSELRMSTTSILAFSDKGVGTPCFEVNFDVRDIGEDQSSIAIEIEPLDFWLDASLPRAIERYADVSLLSSSHIIDEEDIIVEEIDAMKRYNEGMRRDAVKRVSNTRVSLHVRKFKLHAPMPSQPKMRGTRALASADSVTEDALMLKVGDFDLRMVSSPKTCISNISVSGRKIGLNIVKVLPERSCVLNGVDDTAIIQAFDFDTDVAMSLCPEDSTTDLLHISFEMGSKLDIVISSRSLYRALGLCIALERALQLPSSTRDPDLKQITPDTLIVSQSECLRVGKRVRTRINADVMAITVALQASESQKSAQFAIEGLKIQQIARTFGTQSHLNLKEVRISDNRGIIDAVCLTETSIWRNTQSTLRPSWAPVLSYLGKKHNSDASNVDEAVVVNLATIYSSVEDRLAGCLFTIKQELEQCTMPLLQQRARLLEQQESQSLTHPAKLQTKSRSLSAEFVAEQTSLCLRRADDTDDVAVFRLAYLNASFLDMQGKTYGNRTDAEQDFLATITCGSVRAFAGDPETAEGLAWSGVAWPGASLCDKDWAKKPTTDTCVAVRVLREVEGGHFDVNARLHQLRVHISAPILENLLQYANELQVLVCPVTDSTEDFSNENHSKYQRSPTDTQGADVILEISDICVLIPRDPTSRAAQEEMFHWEVRDVVASKLDHLMLQGSYGPGRLGTTTDGGSRRDSLYSDPPADLDESGFFFDARSAVSEDSYARSTIFDSAFSSQLTLTNLVVETWNFEQDLFQTLLRLSVAASAQFEPGQQQLNLSVTPTTASCSQAQYALLLEVLATNDFNRVMSAASSNTASNEFSGGASQARSSVAEGPERRGTSSSIAPLNDARQVVLQCTIESFILSLYMDSGGDSVPRPRVARANSSRSRAVGAELFRFYVEGVEAVLDSPAFPDQGKGSVSLQHLELTTLESGKRHNALRSDRVPFFDLSFALAPDMVQVSGRLANLAVDTFELISATVKFSQVQKYKHPQNLQFTDQNSPDTKLKQQMTGQTGGAPGPASNEAFLRMYYARQAYTPTRIQLPKNVHFEMICEELVVSLSPASAEHKLVFSMALYALAKVNKDKDALVDVKLGDISLARCLERKTMPNTGNGELKAKSEIQWYVIRPMSLDLHSLISIPGSHDPTLLQDIISAELAIDNLQIDIGKEDYLLLLQALNFGSEAAYISKSEGESSIPTDSPSSATSQYSPLPLPKQREVKFNVTLKEASLTLFEDWSEFRPPIMQARMEHLQLLLSQFDYKDLHAQTRADFEILVAVSYWNKRHGSWESIIDPWFCHIGADSPQFSKGTPKERLKHTLGYDKEASVEPLRLASTFINIESSQMLNLNVTSAAVHQLQKAQELTSADPFDKHNQFEFARDRRRMGNGREGTNNLIVRNETGSQVSVSLQRIDVSATGGFFGPLSKSSSTEEAYHFTRMVGCWVYKSDPTGALWRKRYATVEGNSLKYYRDLKAFRQARPLGAINLKSMINTVFLRVQGIVPPRLYRTQRMHRECAFQIVTDTRTYGFVAFSLEDKERMVRALLGVLSEELRTPDVEGSHGINLYPRKVYTTSIHAQDSKDVRILLDGHNLDVFEGNADLDSDYAEQETLVPLISVNLQMYSSIRKLKGKPTSHLGGEAPPKDRVELLGPEYRMIIDNKFGGDATELCSDILSRMRTSLTAGVESEEGSSEYLSSSHGEFLRVDFHLKSDFLQVTSNSENGEGISTTGSMQKLDSIRATLLPSGHDAIVQEITDASGSISIGTSAGWCELDQVLRFDFFTDGALVATTHMVLPSPKTSEDLLRRQELSIFRIGSSVFGQPDLRAPCGTVAVNLTIAEALAPEAAKVSSKHSEGATSEARAGEDVFLRLLDTNDDNQSRKRQALGLSVKVDGFVESEPIPVDHAGRFAISLKSDSCSGRDMPLLSPLSSPVSISSTGAVPNIVRKDNAPHIALVDVHFEEGTKLVEISSCASLKNRLMDSVKFEFERLSLCGPLSPIEDADLGDDIKQSRFAFDQRVDTAWVVNLPSSSSRSSVAPESAWAEYANPENSEFDVVMYSMVSGSKDYDAPSAWLIQGFCVESRKWVNMDARYKVVFTDPFQVRNFSIPRKHQKRCTKVRIKVIQGCRIGSEGPGRTRPAGQSLDEQFNTVDRLTPGSLSGKVSVGNLLFFCSPSPGDAFQSSCIVEPGDEIYIPIECLDLGGIVSIDGGEPIRIHELLVIQPWRLSTNIARRKPRYIPIDRGSGSSNTHQTNAHAVFHVSFHSIRDVAKSLSEGVGLSTRWVITLDPPVRVENALPHAIAAQLLRQCTTNGKSELSSEGCNLVHVPRGGQEHFLCVDPAIGTEGASWEEVLDASSVIDSIKLYFRIYREAGNLDCAQYDAPTILGVARESRYSVPLQNDPNLLIDVQVIPASAKEEQDSDHQHMHADKDDDDSYSATDSDSDDLGDEGNASVALMVSSPRGGSRSAVYGEVGYSSLEDWEGQEPCLWRSRSVPPLRVVLFCRFLVLNWSGLPLIFSEKSFTNQLRSKVVPQQTQVFGDFEEGKSSSEVDDHEGDESESKDLTGKLEKIPLGNSGSKSAKKIVQIHMFSPKDDQMAISLTGERSGWSREFGLVVGMSGEVTIPPVSGGSVVHQVGVQVAGGSGIFLRTKVVSLTPRFVIANLTNLPIQLQQIGAKEGEWQLSLEAGVFTPFHPTDINGDGDLDDKDFSARIGINMNKFMEDDVGNDTQDNRPKLLVSPHFRLDIVKEHLLLLTPDDAEPPTLQLCTSDNTLAAPVIQRSFNAATKAKHHASTLITANVELVDNVVRIMLGNPHSSRAFEYRIDNLSSFVRVGVVQQRQPHARMVLVNPDENNVEFIWPDPSQLHTVEVHLELIGLDAIRFAAKGKHRSVISINFDSIQEPITVKVGETPIEIRVVIKGITRVLSVIDLSEARAHQQVRKALQEHVERIETRLLSDQQLLLNNLTVMEAEMEVDGNGKHSSASMDRNPLSAWRSAAPPATRTHLIFTLTDIVESIEGYSFTVSSLSLHPRRWKLYGRPAEAPTKDSWVLLDDRTASHVRKDLRYYQISQTRHEHVTMFRLSAGCPPCHQFKIEVESTFEVRHLNFYRSSTSLTNTETGESETTEILPKGSQLWVALLEARDLPVMDMYSSDPYVKFRAGTTTKQSKTVSKSLHPCFDEEFYFDLSSPESENDASILELEVFDKDLFTADDFMGQAQVPLNFDVLDRGMPVELWVALSDKGKRRGQVRLAMQLFSTPSSSSARPELSGIRFPVLFEQELRLLRSLRDKLVKEGGVLRSIQTLGSTGGFEGSWGRHWLRRSSTSRSRSFMATSSSIYGDPALNDPLQDFDTDVKVRLSLTVLEADKILSPFSVGWKRYKKTMKNSDIEVYCVVTYGERILRTDPMPLVMHSDSHSGAPRAQEVQGASQQLNYTDRTSTQSYDFEENFDEAGPLGLQLERTDEGLFLIRGIASESPASQKSRIRLGLELVGIQNTRLSSDWSLSALRDMLSTSPRPLRLRFRVDMVSVHPEAVPTAVETSQELGQIAWMQQLTFDEADTMRARARQELSSFGAELEGRQARIALYARNPKEAPSLDLNSTNDTDKRVLVPLLYMFGDDIEIDSELNVAREMSGERDLLLGQGTILLPELTNTASMRRHQLNCPLLISGNVQAGQVSLEVGWSISAPRPADVINLGCDVRLAGLGASLIDTRSRFCELAYFSLSQLRCYAAKHGNGRQVLDIRLGGIQLDNQLPSPVHPIVLSAAPSPYAWLAQEDSCKSSNFLRLDALQRSQDEGNMRPAALLTVVKRDIGDSNSMYVEYCEAFLQEVNVRLEERWLTAIQEFASSFSSADRANVLSQESSSKLHRSHDDESCEGGEARDDKEAICRAFSATSPYQWVRTLSAKKSGSEAGARLLIERADLKPVKINLSFTMTSDVESRDDNRLKILHLMQGIPVLAALFSALVNTVANISDAPLRFNALQIFNESLSQTMLRNTFVQHIMGQLLGNLSQMGNLLASADLLGSPVQLIGSFGQGAYSFFYEPALAMSMGGYLSIGTGLRKGGLELVRSTTHGVSSSLEKFAESASRALSQASLDARYIRLQARRRTDVVHEPINFVEGTLAGSEALSLGVLDAVTGVISLPFREINSRGLVGLVTGPGKAVIGIFVKPLCAMCDASAMFFKGIRNTTETLHKHQLPIRLPRLVRAGNRLGPYSVREAIGIYLLRRCGIADTQTYIYHEYVFGSPVRGLASGLLNSHSEEDATTFERRVERNPLVLLVTDGLVLILHVRTTETLWSAPLSTVHITGFGRLVEIILSSGPHVVPILRRDVANQQPFSRRVTPGIADQIGDAEPLRMGLRLYCKASETADHVRRVVSLAQEGGPAREVALSREQERSLRMARLAVQDPTGAKELGAAVQEHVRMILSGEAGATCATSSSDEGIDGDWLKRRSFQDRDERGANHGDESENSSPPLEENGEAVREEKTSSDDFERNTTEVCRGQTLTIQSVSSSAVCQVAGMSILKAIITSRKLVIARSGRPFVAYRIVVASAESNDVWVVWRRYSEFRTLRDALMRQLQKSRTALAIPARSVWRLSKTALNQRQYGLNLMLQDIIKNSIIRESPLVIQFLTTEADIVSESWTVALSKQLQDTPS